jgi:hypothetical protein
MGSDFVGAFGKYRGPFCPQPKADKNKILIPRVKRIFFMGHRPVDAGLRLESTFRLFLWVSNIELKTIELSKKLQ